MPFYGRKVSNAESDFGIVPDGEQRASVYEVMPANGWGVKVGGFGGKQSGSPSVEFAVWLADSSMNPGDRMGNGAEFSPGTVMADLAGGTVYESLFAAVNPVYSPGGVSIKSIKMVAGKRYAVGAQVDGGAFGHSMVAAAAINADNEKFYYREGTFTPTNPFGYTSSSNEGHMSAWVEYVTNRAPSSGVSAPSGTITDTTPTITGTFTDADSIYGDRITKYRVFVYRSSDGSLMWDSGVQTPTSAEQAAGSYSIDYAGSTLVAGVSYFTKTNVADEFGTWSGLSAGLTFTINAGGAVTPTSPTGKQEIRNPSPLVASWSHVSGLSTNAVEARVKNRSGSIIKASGTMTDSTANGGTISKTWTNAFGSGYLLSWGASYTIEMRARDTAGVWSDWKAIAITTNAAPTVPSQLSPSNSESSSNRPTLTCVSSDDDDSTATGQVVKARIFDNAGVLLGTYSMTKGANNVWRLTTTSTHLPSFGTYSWDAYAGDGTLWSGGVTDEASATKSARATFVYADGPQITITFPAADTVLTTSTTQINWSVAFSGAATQVSYQVLITRVSDGEVIHDSGVVIDNAAASYNVPQAILRDGVSYEFVVRITDSNGLTGTSESRPFSTDFTEPPSITGFMASSEYVLFDSAPSAIRLTWDATSETNFAEYIIGRRVTGDGPEGELILARITSSDTTAYVDYLPASDEDYTYSIRQSVLTGLDTPTSERTESQESVSLDHVVLCDAEEGGAYRVGLHLDSERGYDHVDDLVLEQGWGEEAPFGLFGTADYQVFTGRFTLATDEIATAREFVGALRALKARRAEVCYRDERGRKFFAVISKLTEQDTRIGSYTVDITLTEVSADEGVD